MRKRPPFNPSPNGQLRWYSSEAFWANQTFKVEFTDLEDPDEKWTLTYGMLEKGLQILADQEPDIFEAISGEDYDAGDADSFVQYCLFEKLVYG